MFDKSKIIKNIALNIVSTAIPVILVQLFFLPLVARFTNGNEYGLIITVIGIFTISSQTFGTSLNNVRLILDQEYIKSKLKGDFNVLIIFGSCLCFILTLFVLLFYYKNLSFLHFFLVTIISVINTLDTYYIVAFRLELNYKKVMFFNLCKTLGNCAGILIFLKCGYWELFYLLGFISGLIYIFRKSDLQKEPFKRTILFSKTFHCFLVLILVSFFSSSLIYIDRLVLFPILGGFAVSIYYVSCLFGKIISLIINPVSNVILSYFSKLNELSKKVFLSLLLSSLFLGIIGYFFCITIGPFFLRILYPDFADDAEIYIGINSLTAIINMLCGVLAPVLLKFKNINWQIFIHGGNLIIYLVVSFFLMKKFGLTGFCFGALIAVFLKFIAMLIIGLRTKFV